VLDTSVPALVLKAGVYPLHHGGLAVVRTLGAAGIPVYAVTEDRWAPAGLSRYLKDRFVLRTGGQDTYQRQLLDGLQTVAERIGRPAVLVPTDDHAAFFVADHAATLRTAFLFPDQPPGLTRLVADKAALHERCLALGVPVPAARIVTTAGELREAAEAADFPVVVKQAAPVLLPDGSRIKSTRIIRTKRELLETEVRSRLLLQEHIPADQAEDWLFHGYFDATSSCLFAGTGRKLRSFPDGAGETAYGRAERNPGLERQAAALLTTLRYRGPVSMDYRYDRRDGRHKLLDLNPRIGAIFRLFTTAAGLDVVRAVHLDLTGRPVPAERPVDGRVVIVENHDMRSAWRLLTARNLSLRDLWSQWRAVDETAWFSVTDPVPPLAALARSARRCG
jgi:predicted ATP-grasp superfamily ATP-dependent carboligase